MTPNTPSEYTARAARAVRLLDRLGLEDSPPVDGWPRWALVQKYADTGRGVSFATIVNDDTAALLRDAQREAWDGWLPVELHDLDRGTAQPVRLGFTTDDGTLG